jgi:hypothetical protein
MDAILDEPTRHLPDESAIRDAELPVFNLLDVYPEDRRAAFRVAPWDEHPNAAGHRHIAERLYPELTRFLEQEFGAR